MGNSDISSDNKLDLYIFLSVGENIYNMNVI